MIYNARVKGRQILLENPVRESRAKKELDKKHAARQAVRERKQLGVVGKKEAREKGVWKFDEKQAKCVIFCVSEAESDLLELSLQICTISSTSCALAGLHV
jgi:hypothetical protein